MSTLTARWARLTAIRTEDPNVERRGRALISIYALFAAASLAYLPYIVIRPIYDDTRVCLEIILCGLSAFFLGMVGICKRGSIDASLGIVTTGLVMGPTAAAMILDRPAAAMWLLNVACLLTCLAVSSRQTIYAASISYLSIILVALHLSEYLEWQRVVAEYIRLAITVTAISTLAALSSTSHRDMLRTVRRREDESKRAMAAAQRSREAAEEEQEWAERANTLKTQFLADMSHELRTPLNAILGYAQLMREELRSTADVPKETMQDIASVEQAGEHLLLVVNDILDASRLEAGRMPLNPEAVAVADLMSAVHEHARTRRVEADVEYVGAHGDAYVHCDVGLMSKLIVLLAVELSMGGRGKIVVGSQLLDGAHIELHLSTLNGADDDSPGSIAAGLSELRGTLLGALEAALGTRAERGLAGDIKVTLKRVKSSTSGDAANHRPDESPGTSE